MTKLILTNLFIILFALGCNVAKQEKISESVQGQTTTTTVKSNITFDMIGSTATEGTSTSISLTRDSGVIENQVVTIQIYQPPGNADQNDIINVLNNALPVIPALFPDSNAYFDITFSGTSLTTSFDFDIFDDTDFEGSEALMFRIVDGGANDYNFYGNPYHTVAITDNDVTPTLFLSDGAAGVAQTSAEGTSINLVVELTTASSSDVTATLTWSGQTSSNDHDFTQQTVVIPAGSLSTIVPINLNNDLYNELSESFDIVFVSSTGADITAGPSNTHTITITDATGVVTDTDITFTTIATALNEVGSTSLIVTAQFNGTLEHNLTVPITFGGTAGFGIDYLVSSQSFNFSANTAGATSSVIINIINDDIYEGIESIDMSFGATSFSTVGASSFITHTVAEDEIAPVIEFQNLAYNASEGGNFNIPLKLNNAASQDVTVDYIIDTAPLDSASIGSDHSLAISGTFTIPAGAKNLNQPIYINDDGLFESDEKIYISISNPTVGSSLGVNTTLEITIKEAGSLPIISFASSYQNISEANTATVTLTVNEASAIDQDFDIIVNHLSASALDYTAFATSQTLLAGQTSIDILVPILADAIYEPTEHLQLKIAQPTGMQVGTNSTHSLYLVNTTIKPTLDISSGDLILTEGDTGSFDLTLSGSSTGYNLTIPYTVSGIATVGDDHDLLASGNFTIPSGSASITINFNTIIDSIYEGPATEDIIVTIGTGNNYTLGINNITYTLTEALAAPVIKMETPTRSVYENDLVNIAVELDTPLNADLEVTINIDDYYNAGACNALGKCAHITDTSYIHSNGVLSAISFDNGASLSAADPATKEKILQFGATPPTGGSLVINGYSGSTFFLHGSLDNTTSATYAQSLALLINTNLEASIQREVYAYYKAGTDAIILIPRTPSFDSDLYTQMSANSITVNVPAGTTYGVANFSVIADNTYESGVDEYFTMQISATDNASVTIDPLDITEVKIIDIDNLPEASFQDPQSIKIEGINQALIPITLSNKSESEVTYKVQFYQTGLATYNPVDKNDFTVLNYYSNGNVTGMENNSYMTPTQYPAQYYYSMLYDENNPTGDDIDYISGDCTIQGNEDFSVEIEIPTTCRIEVNYNGGTADSLGYGINYADIQTFLTTEPTLSELRDYYTVTATTPTTLKLVPYRLPPLTYASNLIHEAQITIKAESLTDYIALKFIDDTLYENTEDMLIVISQTAPGQPTVNPNADEHTLILSDNDAAPSINITSTSAYAIPEGDSVQVDHTLLDETIDFTDIDFKLSLSGINQHSDTSFDVSFSGVNFAGQFTDFTSISDFMQGDIIVDYSAVTFPSNPTYPTIAMNLYGFSIGLSAGMGLAEFEFLGKVHKDIRYEGDEVLGTSITNTVGLNVGAASIFNLIQDDDTEPFLKNTTFFGGILNIVNEKDNDNTFTSSFSVLNSKNTSFSGPDATQVPVYFDMDINLVQRHSVTTNTISATYSLNSSNDYAYEIEPSSSQVGHIRAIKQIQFVSSNPVNASNWTTGPMFSSNCNATDCTKTYTIETDDVKVYTNKVSWINMGAIPTDGFVGYTCSLYRGQASCFGTNGYGQLGRESSVSTFGKNGEDVTDQSGVIDFGTDSNGNPLYVLDLALGQEHACALLNTNQVKCWGNNDNGELGIGAATTIDLIGDDPGEMGNNLQAVDMGTTQTIIAIKAMAFSTCAWFESGNIKCWGANNYGQLGLENTTPLSAPGGYVKGVSSGPDAQFTLFETGSDHACAVRDDNKFICWGYGGKGQLTNSSSNFGNIGDSSGEMNLATNFRSFHTSTANIESIAIGREHTCVTFTTASTPTFNTRCWGSNTYGQLGLGRASQIGSYNVGDSHYNSIGPGTNIMRNLGDYINGGTQHPYFEPYKSSGSYFSASPIADEGWYNIPYNAVTANGVDDHTIDLGVTKNQFVQIREPASKVTAGGSYSCSVQTSDEQGARDPFIRCWGSNYTDPSVGSTTFTDVLDIGILNNIGYSKEYSGTGNIPYADSGSGIITLPNFSCDDDPNYPNNIPYTDECRFARRLAFIGDDASTATANDYVNDYFDADHEWGWVDNAFLSPNKINFELNYKYSEVDIDFAAQYVGGISDINLTGGNFHQCAVPVASSPTNDALSSSKFICWGSNGYGQAGIDTTPSYNPDPTVCEFDKVGSFNSCGDAKNGKFFDLDYTY